MNERLKQLTDEASLYAVSDNSSMLFDVWKKRYTEKFAQLIVLECAQTIQEYVDHRIPASEYPSRLKKHFE